MANNYSTTSLSAGGTQFFILGNTNGDTLPTARAPSINKLSTSCTDAAVALYKRVNASGIGSGREKARRQSISLVWTWR